MMDSNNQLFLHLYLFLVFLLSGQKGLLGEAGPTKLFVFGDSYADTGNGDYLSCSWKEPYGITFPGKPAGRFSDGRILTDLTAAYLGVPSPIPYRLGKQKTQQYLKHGMNFAIGGTGVFDTSTPVPNMTSQIDLFQHLVKRKAPLSLDLNNSMALVSVAGNDYDHYLTTNGSIQNFPSFIASVVNQIGSNLKRIQELGVKKIVVGGLQPLGCLPYNTIQFPFQQCNSTFNDLTVIHNTLLNQTVTKLKQQTNHNTTFVILNLYDSFMSVLNQRQTNNNIENRLKPCCVGISSEYMCGSVDENNVKKYKVCDNPKSAFFWDQFHPTQAGWEAVYDNLRNSSALQHFQY
ncbi:GDSL esterase/lipase At5g03610-like [Abrus precatorius]|uniref:GDSL esterase/lipase At5g03610-like n=1 Tax=Abrus precatorius TaxID=3816 RepID=A0A8B8MEN3_ABRPR|nr:GDSL esterase/lipase At5g03610-like [Abrus precatorius]